MKKLLNWVNISVHTKQQKICESMEFIEHPI
jgi:hypothetical protein